MLSNIALISFRYIKIILNALNHLYRIDFVLLVDRAELYEFGVKPGNKFVELTE